MNIEQKDIDRVIEWLEVQQLSLEHLEGRTKDLCRVQVTTLTSVLKILQIPFDDNFSNINDFK